MFNFLTLTFLYNESRDFNLTKYLTIFIWEYIYYNIYNNYVLLFITSYDENMKIPYIVHMFPHHLVTSDTHTNILIVN